MTFDLQELRKIYQDSFIENYEMWHKVMLNFNFVSSRIYINEWNKNVLREEIQFLPYNLEPITYDNYCELFLISLNEFNTQPNGEEIFYKMIEQYLLNFYLKYTVVN